MAKSFSSISEDSLTSVRKLQGFIFIWECNALRSSDTDMFSGYMCLHVSTGAMGYMVSMDQNGDAEGNYTLIARKKRNSSLVSNFSSFGLHSIGGFFIPDNASQLPVKTWQKYQISWHWNIFVGEWQILNLLDDIEWVGSGPPADSPVCGFDGEKCEGKSMTGMNRSQSTLHEVHMYRQFICWLILLLSFSSSCQMDPWNVRESSHLSGYRLDSRLQELDLRTRTGQSSLEDWTQGSGLEWRSCRELQVEESTRFSSITYVRLWSHGI